MPYVEPLTHVGGAVRRFDAAHAGAVVMAALSHGDSPTSSLRMVDQAGGGSRRAADAPMAGRRAVRGRVSEPYPVRAACIAGLRSVKGFKVLTHSASTDQRRWACRSVRQPAPRRGCSTAVARIIEPPTPRGERHVSWNSGPRRRNHRCRQQVGAGRRVWRAPPDQHLACVVNELHSVDSCVGDWVLVHVGFAMSRIDEREAQLTLELLQQLGEAQSEIDAHAPGSLRSTVPLENLKLAGSLPVSGRRIGRIPRELEQQLLDSVRQKAAESAAVKQRFFARMRGTGRRDRAGDLAAVHARGGRLYTMGNGGSSCDSAHIAVEFQHPATAGAPALPAIDLANDTRHADRRGERCGIRSTCSCARSSHSFGPGDALIGVSTSGNSANLLLAFSAAKRQGATTIGLAGGDGRQDARATRISITVSWRRATASIGCRKPTLRSITSCGTSRTRCSPTTAPLAPRRRHDMRFADEFRDPDKARALVGEISRLAEPLATARGRPLQVMEVCGGHTHTIFRYGLKAMLPDDTIEFVHGPGCPVCVLPMGRVDDCVALARDPKIIFTTFGDAMRVPGSQGSLLQAKAERRGTCAWCIPRSTPSRSPGTIPRGKSYFSPWASRPPCRARP